jgi:hypothetical protein
MFGRAHPTENTSTITHKKNVFRMNAFLALGWMNEQQFALFSPNPLKQNPKPLKHRGTEETEGVRIETDNS